MTVPGSILDCGLLEKTLRTKIDIAVCNTGGRTIWNNELLPISLIKEN